MNEQPKKSFFGRFWWVGLLIIIIVFGIIFAKNNKEQEKVNDTNTDKNISGGTDTFSTTELTAANTALINGIKIDDPQNDWVKFPEGTMQPDGRPDNSNPYPLGWTDIKSLSLGADSQYLYVKFEFWGIFPDKPVTIDGDTIGGGCGKINNFTFTNSEGKKDYADLISNLEYTMDGNGQIKGISQVAMISPSGEDEKRETIFKIFSQEGMMAGGPGTDYFLSVYPLSQFNLKIGDDVTFDSSGENGSTKYHHEAIDAILSNGTKTGSTIKYKLGSNNYEILISSEEKK